MPNRLANSTSPYLLQHQDNPVDWYEWGDQALEIARNTDRPILLSVGYSACHWCHVMAHESFEDEATADYMNANFVNIKVDREERPDIDRIYMDALQAMSGHGGWPMTVFTTPEGEPFFAGTYFPKEPRGHMPTFRQVLESVADAWHNKRAELADQATRLSAAVQAGMPPEAPPLTAEAAATGLAALAESHDPRWGGFGTAPKFPQSPVLGFLLRHIALRPDSRNTIEPMLRRTLDAMRSGGIYDQIGGGFARYSVDEQWLIPHFEKMLYDNALLAQVYLHAGQLLDEPAYTATAVETLDYLANEMVDGRGGIHAAEDADSEGVEGLYYVWDWSEFNKLAGDDGAVVGTLYGVTPAGNFEGKNNLHLANSIQATAAQHQVTPQEVEDAKSRVDAALMAARSRRIRPGRDDKVIAAWNGLALQAFSVASAVLQSATYRDIAIGIAEFVTGHMVRPDGRLLRSWRQGETSGPAFCDDYAAMAVGLFNLFQVTADQRWYQEAVRLTREMIRLFGDEDGFFSPGADAADLIARPKDFADNPLPSANSLAAEALLLMTAYTGEAFPQITGIARGAARLLERAPTAVGHLLAVLTTEESGVKEVAIVGSPQRRRSLESVMWEKYRPDCVLAAGAAAGAIPLLADRTTIDGEAAAYVCRGFVCDLVVASSQALRDQLSD